MTYTVKAHNRGYQVECDQNTTIEIKVDGGTILSVAVPAGSKAFVKFEYDQYEITA